MCESGPGGTASPFAQAMACVLQCMKDRVLGGDRDQVGVLLYGTEQTKVPHGQGFPNIYLLQELEEPSANSMRAISLLIAATSPDTPAEEVASLTSMPGLDFGHLEASSSATLELGNVLWVTSILFNSCAVKKTRRRVYLFTNDDSPCASNPAARSRALTRSRDLQDAHVWVEPFFFPPAPSRSFDLGESSFWRELVTSVRANYKPPIAAPADGAAADADAADAFYEDTSDEWLRSCVATDGEALIERVRRKARRKRVQWSSELRVGAGCDLSFVMVSLVRPWKKPNSKKLEARSNEELASEMSLTCNVHGHALLREDVFKAYQYGGKWVYFDQSELSGFGSEQGLGESGITLLGFKDRSLLKLHHNIRAAKFLEPTERLPGSTQAMAALVQSMAAKGKIGIARFAKGRVGEPRLVALLPQLLELDDAASAGASLKSDGGAARTKLPCGLHVIPLPYAEEVRSIAKPRALTANEFTEEQLASARALVTALKLPPEKSPIGTVINPAAASHYEYLEMMALNVPGAAAPTVVDGTLPDVAWLEQSGAQIAAFREAYELAREAEADAGTAKRQRTSAAPKAEKAAPPSSLAEWIASHVAGRLSELTNPLLKEFCKSHGLAVGGKKDDLLARISDFLDGEMARDAGAAGGTVEA